MDSLVSVVIPAYKAEFLYRAISSVLEQTYTNIELIIVNDKSPENLDEIVSSSHDSRIIYYVNEKNIGANNPVENWNKCLSYAKGEYFCLLCDDDYYEPTFIEKMLKLADKFPSVSVFRARVRVVDSLGHLRKQSPAYSIYPSAPEWESNLDYMWHIFSHYRSQTISEFMYRRRYIVQSGGFVSFPLAWYSDVASCILFAWNGGISSESEILVNFRMSGNNISSRFGCTVRDKVRANLLFNEWCLTILKKEQESDLKELVILQLVDYIEKQNDHLLTLSDMKDFLYVFIHRKNYNIRFGVFLKSFLRKIIEIKNVAKNRK